MFCHAIFKPSYHRLESEWKGLLADFLCVYMQESKFTSKLCDTIVITFILKCKLLS